ncbi:flagellar M-ring protein FliF C-terminal domain-containing protein, partial [Rosenbergiella nectarea]
ELDKTVRHTQLSTGGIKRLSVAVIVNYQENEQGKEEPLSTEQIEQITGLVKQAMGYSAERGDSINVVNTRFTANELDDDAGPWWQQPNLISLALQALRWLVVIIIATVLYRK